MYKYFHINFQMPLGLFKRGLGEAQSTMLFFYCWIMNGTWHDATGYLYKPVYPHELLQGHNVENLNKLKQISLMLSFHECLISMTSRFALKSQSEAIKYTYTMQQSQFTESAHCMHSNFQESG